MPFADNNGVQIHFELSGDGPPLVIHHGLSSDMRGMEFYAKRLQANFQTIRVDARGHGQSSRLTDPAAYSPALMAGDVVAVLDLLGHETCALLGYSMGGLVGYAMARHYPERLTALAVGGAVPAGLANSERAALDALKERLQVGAQAGGAAYVEYTEQTFGPMDPVFADRQRAKSRTDFQANVAAIEGLFASTADNSAAIRQLAAPSLIFIGENEEFYRDFDKYGPAQFPDTECIIVAGMAHYPLTHIDEILDFLERFFLKTL